jgi:hypothetical protein
MKKAFRPTLALTAIALTGSLVGGRPAEASGAELRAARAEQLTIGLDFAEARKELSGANPDDPIVAIASGRLALYEGDCDLALVLLARTDVSRMTEGAQLADIARGCARVTAATVIEQDKERSVEVRYQDESDRALTPLIASTVVSAREALTRDLGVSWPLPTRITVVRDLMSLSVMTGLPEKDAQTTGTVAVAKWGRVTLLSPRASQHGYSWRDTIAHELTHLAVTRATIDRAPLWLQEGVAKREEVRWRDPGPFDDRPSADAIVTRGASLKLDLPLDKLGPSIAMLPSADAAMVAFAEVTSFVRYLADEAGPDALPKLLASLRSGKSPDDALRDATGATLHEWDTRWRLHLASKPKEALPEVFGLGAPHADLRDLSRRARLAELLFGRGHPAEALQEIDHVVSPHVQDDPSFRYLRARVLESLDRSAEGATLVGDPQEVASSFGPWWAVRGRWARAKGEEATASSAFVEAVASDPFGVESACEGIEITHAPKSPLGIPLCEAARKREDPGLGRE